MIFFIAFYRGSLNCYLDGGVEGFIQPLIASIYKDGYTNDAGEYVEFDNSNNFFEKYSKIFDDYGGWANVFTQAAVGGGSSLIGEAFDLRKYLKGENKSTNAPSIKNSVDVDDDFDMDAKLNSLYNEIMNIMQYDEHGEYGELGNAQQLGPEFYGIEHELSDLNSELSEHSKIDTPEINNIDDDSTLNNTITQKDTIIEEATTKSESLHDSIPDDIKEINDIIDDTGKYKYEPINKVKNESNGQLYTVYSNYERYKEAQAAYILNVINSLDKDEKEIIKRYISESQLRSYKTMNGINRGTLFDYEEVNGKKVITGVSLYGIYSTQHYTLEEFTEMLKGKGMTLSDFVEQAKSDVQLLKRAIEKSPLTENMVLFRGVGEKFLKREFGVDLSTDNFDTINQKIMSKGILSDPSFLSSSATPTAGPFCSKDIQLILNCEKGTPALDFSQLGGITNEQELLLAPGQGFKITKVEKVNGKIRIYGDSINPKTVTNSLDPVSTPVATTASNIVSQSGKFNNYLDKEPVIKNMDELTDYISKTISQSSSEAMISPDGISKSAAALSKYIDSFLANDSVTGYYELLNVSGIEIPDDIKALILQETINNNKSLREAISLQADYEIASSLESLFGITDKSLIKKVKETLLGDSFIEDGIGASHNWDEYVSVMEPYFKAKVQSLIDSGKEPVIWSKIDDSCHEIMNHHFTTIENTTLGGEMYFLDSVYSNWNNSKNGPMLESLWEKLSKLYADACSSAINPKTGKKFTSIKTVELPELLSNSTFDTITMTKVIPETMEIVDSVDIDISDIAKFYDNSIGLDDTILTEIVFKEFLKKIKEAM